MALSELKIKLSVEADIEGDALRIHELINDQRVKTSVYFLQEQKLCKWPTCQSEEYQQALAEQVKQELIGEQPVYKVKD